MQHEVAASQDGALNAHDGEEILEVPELPVSQVVNTVTQIFTDIKESKGSTVSRTVQQNTKKILRAFGRESKLKIKNYNAFQSPTKNNLAALLLNEDIKLLWINW